MSLECLLNSYEKRKHDIKKRLREFKEVFSEMDERIFAELCFCICTPQSRARLCNKAISGLERSGVLFTGDYEKVLSFLRGVRFPENKARYIIGARRFFTKDGTIKIKERLTGSPTDIRRWLAENVKGIGYKEASHFLRNVGLGENLAILDRHILKNLKKYGVIDEISKSLTRKKYLEIEKKMLEFSRKINIPLAELDLLFWSEETGEIFK